MSYEFQPDGSRREYASAWRRLRAGLCDWGKIVLIGLGVGFLAGVATCTGVVVLGDPFDENMIALAPLVYPFPAILIIAPIAHIMFAFSVARHGETPGHGQVGLSIIREDGEELGKRRAVLRQFVGSPLLLITFLGVVVALTLWIVGELLRSLYGSSDPTDLVIDFLGNRLSGRLWFVPLVLAIANHVWMAIDRKGRGWHDLIFGTVVVQDGWVPKGAKSDADA